MRYVLPLLLCPLLTQLVHGQAVAQEAAADRVLQQHCIECHGQQAAESGLRLDNPVEVLGGGDSGERVVVPGDSAASHLLERVTTTDPNLRMPPDSPPLPKAHVEILRDWIDDASVWAQAQTFLAGESLSHWSFQPLTRPEIPPAGKVDDTGGSGHPIDAFIDSRLNTAGLTRSGVADRRTLIRRLYLVMHGLPPTPEQVDQFLSTGEGTWADLVDGVLASPHYGERMATVWLDLVRYGESNGYETNRERPHAWRYRDWVVDSFNDDKPYDQFALQQIAGDAVGEGMGTGFLVAGPYDIVKGKNPELTQMQRQDELADIINAVGTTFMGLTLGCARCHNHKFDPVTQSDYYSLQAVFAGVNYEDRRFPLPKNVKSRVAELNTKIDLLRNQLAQFLPAPDRYREPVNVKRNIETFAPLNASAVRFTIHRSSQSEPCIDELEVFAKGVNVALAEPGVTAESSGNFEHPFHKLEHINDGRYGNRHSWISKQAAGGWVVIRFARPATVDRIEWGRDRQEKFADRLAIDYDIELQTANGQWERVAGSDERLPWEADGNKRPRYDFDAHPKQDAEQGRRWLTEVDRLIRQRDELNEPVMAWVGTFRQPGPTHRLYRGEPAMPREEVPPAGIKALSDVSLAFDAPEQQRRLEVARWIASDENPMTARVIVNRLWQFHFGTGLVDTPSDFGANGSTPTHPKLLDWLALELIQNNWSLKHLHRLILTSRTWQQQSTPRDDAVRVDADTRLCWRFPPRRLSAEAIRDSIVSVSGKLDRRVGGRGFPGFIVEAENVRHYFPKTEFGPADWRRMLYMTRIRQERDAVFGVFDCPDFNQVVPQRTRSTTPLQALNLLNSRFVNQQAEFFAARLEDENQEDPARITRAWELCFSRPPSLEEVQMAEEFLADSDWSQLTRALLNANEFVFLP